MFTWCNLMSKGSTKELVAVGSRIRSPWPVLRLSTSLLKGRLLTLFQVRL